MTINIAWDDDAQTTLRLNYDGKWTWNQWYAALDEASALIQATGERVYIIHDLGDTLYLPGNAMAHFKKNAMHFANCTHLTVLVSPNRFQHIMFKGFMRIAGHWAEAYRTANDVSSARKLIAEDIRHVQL